MGDLVSLETWKMENEGKDKSDEDCIDFAAATTATLGVPSPSLSRGKSFEESPRSISDQHTLKKGDAEEEAQLLEVLKLSVNDLPSREAISAGDVLMPSDVNVHVLNSIPVNSVHVSEELGSSGPLIVEPSVSGSHNVHGNSDRNIPLSEEQAASPTLADDTHERENHSDQLISVQLGEVPLSNDLAKCTSDTPILNEATPSSPAKDTVHDQEVENFSTPVMNSTGGLYKQNVEENSGVAAGHADSESSSGGKPSIEAVESFTSSLDGSEPIYEGEECILDPGKTVCGDREPVYEGEMVLAEQADKGIKDTYDASSKEEISPRQGTLDSVFRKFPIFSPDLCYMCGFFYILFLLNMSFFYFKGNLSATS